MADYSDKHTIELLRPLIQAFDKASDAREAAEEALVDAYMKITNTWRRPSDPCPISWLRERLEKAIVRVQQGASMKSAELVSAIEKIRRLVPRPALLPIPARGHQFLRFHLDDQGPYCPLGLCPGAASRRPIVAPPGFTPAEAGHFIAWWEYLEDPVQAVAEVWG